MKTGYESKRSDFDARIQELEEELSKTKYNKKTQHHIGLVKAKIAELKERKESRQKSGTTGYTIKKAGDGTVALVGFPSVGKSTLLNALTNAESKVGAYDFTTLDVIPGTLNMHSAKIQIFDVPGLVEGAASGSGRGKEVLAAVRSTDLIVLVIDVNKPHQYDLLMKEVEHANLRLNQHPPNIRITGHSRGGLEVTATTKLKQMSLQTIKEMLQELNVLNAEVVIREDITPDQLIDAVKGNRVYLSAITVINKADSNPKKAEQLKKEINADICISAQKKEHLNELKELIFKRLGLIRIYLKEVGKPADKEEPLIMKKGATVEAICKKIHRTFVDKFKTAKIWGSAKFPGQSFGLDKEVKDLDIVEIHTL